MRNFQPKKNWRSVLESRPILIFLSILVLFFAWSVFGFWGKMEETAQNKKIAEDKIAQLTTQKQKLASDIANLQTNEGVEASIRDKFGMEKAGEGMIVIVDNQNATAAAPTSSGFWSFFNPLGSFWKNLFK